MVFAQLTYRESLRDIEVCLNSAPRNRYHLGLNEPVARSTLADANSQRDWRIYAELGRLLIARARKLYADDDFGLDLQETVYAMDSTTIDLCLAMFPWANFRSTKAAVKLHTALDLRGSIPAFLRITDGKTSDVVVLDDLVIEPGSFYVVDRGYLDFERLQRIAEASAFFVTRAKRNQRLNRLKSRPVDRATGLRCDQIVWLTNESSRKDYPNQFRRIRYVDPDTKKSLIFLTNNTELPALTIAGLYKRRWQIELFFKWIKQHLRIKSFYGTSPNAVQTQVWIAICVYVMVAILKKELRIQESLYTILQVLSVNSFEQVPLAELFANNDSPTLPISNCNQLIFNDF